MSAILSLVILGASFGWKSSEIFNRLPCPRRPCYVISDSLAAFIEPNIGRCAYQFPVFGKVVNYAFAVVGLILFLIGSLLLSDFHAQFFFKCPACHIINAVAETLAVNDVCNHRN